MGNVLARISKKQKLIQLCEKPMSFTDLKREVDISDAGLSKDLKTLQKRGWLRKSSEGMYKLTSSGRKILPQVQRVESVLGKFKTSQTLVKYVTFSHQGLEGEDADLLEHEIAQAIERYIAKHPDKPITLMIQHNPPEATSNPSQ